MRKIIPVYLLLFGLVLFYPVAAQNELAATLEILSAGVEVQRVNTSLWLPVKVEAIVGVGDMIRTDATGLARITFFADGVDTEIEPNTTYKITRFEGDENTFNIEAEVLVGRTTQRLNRLLDANSSYDINTPGMTMVARGTAFAVRVEETGRSAMLVSEGTVGADNDTASAAVPPGYGIRGALGSQLSDVVRATSFEGLDSALDGCQTSISTPDDVSLNVRIGPGLDFPVIGMTSASEIDDLMGVTESTAWYRLSFRGGFGWILSSTAQVTSNCAGLRVFPDTYGPEDLALYEYIGNPINPDELTIPTPESTPEPESSS
jgi:hypothetical protein